MTTYRFHWRSGEFEDGIGESVEQAFSRLGYGGGAIAALDRWEVIKTAGDEQLATDA